MDRFCKDVGASWSHFVYPEITAIIPMCLLGGLTVIREIDLSVLSLFYAAMLHSYVHANVLFYSHNKVTLLPQNLWFTSLFPF